MIDGISPRFRFDRPFERPFRNRFSELAPRPQHSVQKIPSNGMQNLPIFLWTQETCIYLYRPIFLAVKCVESLTKTLKNVYLTVSIFKIFRGSMPPDPPRKARALPSQWSLRDHSLNHVTSQVSRLQLSKSWQVCAWREQKVGVCLLLSSGWLFHVVFLNYSVLCSTFSCV